ncbi:MAG: response regulator transcription factor [Saccharothrix sp.]|nr:response regulator transcription factor [Saccharothrix sp.]
MRGTDDGDRAAVADAVDRDDATRACRVLLCEDNDLVRTGVRTILDAEPDLRVVAEVARHGDLRRVLRLNRPDVVVSEFPLRVDQRPPVFGGLPMVVLCAEASASSLDGAIRIGVRGLVLRSDASRHVVDAVRAVAAGEAFVAPSVAGYVLDQLALRMPTVSRSVDEHLHRLTARELEVLRLVASGLTTVQVAQKMQRSRATVKSHISHILNKLGLQDRAQAIAMAYQAGLITNGAALAVVSGLGPPG